MPDLTEVERLRKENALLLAGIKAVRCLRTAVADRAIVADRPSTEWPPSRLYRHLTEVLETVGMNGVCLCKKHATRGEST